MRPLLADSYGTDKSLRDLALLGRVSVYTGSRVSAERTHECT